MLEVKAVDDDRLARQDEPQELRVKYVEEDKVQWLRLEIDLGVSEGLKKGKDSKKVTLVKARYLCRPGTSFC